ncbi:citryl-CoA lyase [Actinomadura macra]|uniref:citryl-CoA lyase n=1 Tax=Actinomadura macra TaxID=46164 RepID=UPI000A05F3CB|nr:citryl-CoA lyase [Actinomadura macra]
MTETVYHLLARSSTRRPHAAAVIDESAVEGGRSRSFSELLADVDKFATGLAALGFRRGDALALYLPNCRQWPTVFFAAAKIGVLLVPLNTRYRANEIYHLLRTSRARGLITAPMFEGIDFGRRLDDVWQRIREAPESVKLEWLITVGPPPQGPLPDSVRTMEFAEVASSNGPGQATARPDDPLIAFGTSGTTSAPKLAVHTHHTVTLHANAVADRENLPEHSTQLNVLSLNGTFGFVPFIAGIAAGTTAVLLPAFDRGRIVDAITSHAVDYLVSAEGPLRELLEDDTFRRIEPRTLRTVVTAGTAISDIVSSAATLGIAAFNVYGSSELFAFAGKWPPNSDAGTRTVPGGMLVDAAMQVRAVSTEDHTTVLPPGEDGELQFRGDTLFVEYLNNPDATANSRTEDGWFGTGDVGCTRADGRSFEYRSRLGDAMRLKGYLVNPADIESTLNGHPAVAQAHVVSVRDHRSGDDLAVAFVQVREGATASEQDLVAHCRANLASFKVPTRVRVVDDFPTTASANGDKIRKDKLRAKAAWALGIPTPTFRDKDGLMSSPEPQPIRSDIAWATPDRVVVHGYDLPHDLLGKVNLGDFAYLELFKTLPTAQESIVFNSLVVSLVEHGLTPSALVSRLTALGAPESLQGAVAAGLLGLGDTFVGTIEGAARICQSLPDDGWQRDETLLRKHAQAIVDESRAARKSIPGLGHPVHKPNDPRAERLFEIARENGLDDANERLFRTIRARAEDATGTVLPINATGAIGAIASTLRVPWNVARGLGVMARAIGLVGHLLEDRERPLAKPVWNDAEARSTSHRG